MFSRDDLKLLISRIPCCAFALIFLSLPLSGCKLNMSGSSQTWWKKPGCNLPNSPTKEVIVNRINQQVEKIESWQCEQAKIRFKGGSFGIPMSVSANITVAKPLNFRMIIKTSLTGTEGDVGSNNDQFWFWVRRNDPKYLFTCSHEDTGIAREKLQVPFEVDWLMEVMGVVPLNSEDFVLQTPETKNGILSLVATKSFGNGNEFKRIILIDSCYGRIIAHELRDSSNRLIAHADLNNYRKIKKSGVMLPHEIDLILNQPSGPSMKIQISLRNISVNLDKEVLANRWRKPHYNGYPEFDIGKNYRREYQAVHSPKTINVEHQQSLLDLQESQHTTHRSKQTFKDRVRPPWVEEGKTEYVSPEIYTFKKRRPGQTKLINSETIIQENPQNTDFQQDENNELFIPDEEPDWSE